MDISDTFRNSLEDVLNWAKDRYQKQALREQLKTELQRSALEQISLLKRDWYQESVMYVSEAKTNLKDAFISKKIRTYRQI